MQIQGSEICCIHTVSRKQNLLYLYRFKETKSFVFYRNTDRKDTTRRRGGGTPILGHTMDVQPE